LFLFTCGNGGGGGDKSLECKYECCNDSDCDDGNPYTSDICIQPNSSDSKCEHSHPYTRSNYYDYCWEYDCTAQIPYPKLENPVVPDVVEVMREIKGVGDISIIVVFLYAYDSLPEDKLDILKLDEADIRSFKYAAKWFEDQASKYGLNLNINVDFSNEQYKVPEEYIIHDLNESLSKDLYKYITDKLPQYLNYDVIVPFYYSSVDFSFVNHVIWPKSFVIFSKQAEQNFFCPLFEEGTTDYSITFAHELSHIFGATDKYSCSEIQPSSCEYALQNGISCIIESDNPDELGRDIMCHRVPEYSNEQWSFTAPNLNELVIIEPTAKELGWWDFDGDGIIEVEDSCPYVKNNICP
jgi:hypothetical protein